MPEFLDSEIMEMRRNAKRKKAVDFSHVLLIEDEEFQFTRTYLCEEKVSLFLPVEFINMPNELAKLKYPMEQRPDVIKTNVGFNVNFAFSLLPQTVSEKQIGEALEFFLTLIKKMQPANRFFEDKVEKTDHLIFGWFDFKSPGIDESLYTMMAFTVIDHQLFHGVFNCRYKSMEEWKPIALQVFRSAIDETLKKYEMGDRR